MYPPEEIGARSRKKLTKQQAIEAIKDELLKKYHPERVLSRAKEKEDDELTKLVAAMNRGMGASTAAAALLKKIAHEDVVYDWRRGP